MYLSVMEKTRKEKFKLHCKRCQNPFFARQPRPKYCNLCKSSLWNSPRVYEVVGGERPTRRRTTATGKRAATQIAELENEHLTAPRGSIVEIKSLDGKTFAVCSLENFGVGENHILAGRSPSKKDAEKFALEKGWHIQPNLL